MVMVVVVVVVAGCGENEIQTRFVAFDDIMQYDNYSKSVA